MPVISRTNSVSPCREADVMVYLRAVRPRLSACTSGKGDRAQCRLPIGADVFSIPIFPGPVTRLTGACRTAAARLAAIAAVVAALLLGGTVHASADPEPAPASAAAADVAVVPKMESPPSSVRAAPSTASVSRSDIIALIEQEAKRAGLPAEIAEAVVHTESGFNRNAVGADGEIGLMQVLPSTARMMGFGGSLAELAVPATNIRYGVNYLAKAWRLAGRDLCTAVMKYRAGHGETRFSHLSVDYCIKVRARVSARGYAVAGVVPVATFGAPGGARCRGQCLTGSRGGANLAALNSKLNQIVFRVTVLRVPMP
jgi:soluble lytic murein transglycosylase-like protein